MGRPFKIEKAIELLKKIEDLELKISIERNFLDSMIGIETTNEQKLQIDIAIAKMEDYKTEMRNLIGVASGDTVKLSNNINVIIKVLEEITK